MTATFFPVTADELTIPALDDLCVNVSNVNANRVQKALGLPLNDDQIPYGEVAAGTFTGMAELALATTTDPYLITILGRLVKLGFEAMAFEGSKVIWA